VLPLRPGSLILTRYFTIDANEMTSPALDVANWKRLHSGGFLIYETEKSLGMYFDSRPFFSTNLASSVVSKKSTRQKWTPGSRLVASPFSPRYHHRLFTLSGISV